MPDLTPDASDWPRFLCEAMGASFDTVILARADGTVYFWSNGAESTLGHAQKEMEGRSLFERMSDDQAREARRIFGDTLAGSPFCGPWLENAKDGRKVTRKLRVFRYCREDGTAAGVVCLGLLAGESRMQETERAWLAARLAEWRQLEALGLVAAGLAHELNNQITMIAHSVELAEMLDEPKRYREACVQVQALIERSRHTVERIQAFGREASGRKTRLDLAELTLATLRMLRASVPPEIRLNGTGSTSGCPMLANTNQVQEILIHLVRAAVAELPAGGGVVELELVLEPRAKATDPGKVMSSAKGERAWWRLRATGVERTPGLWSCLSRKAAVETDDDGGANVGSSDAETLAGRLRELLREQGGQVRSLTEDACLDIEWALLTEAGDEREGAGREDGESALVLAGLHLVVVEDEPRELDLLREVLTAHGAKVSAFLAAGDFLRWLPGGAPPDALIVDEILEGQGGEELIARFRGVAPGAPALLIGGRLKTGTRTGADGCKSRVLGKPFAVAKLVREVMAMTGRQRPVS